MSSILSLVSSSDTIKPKKPRKTTNPIAPPSLNDLNNTKTNYSPPAEGFQSGKKYIRFFPIYSGHSVHFYRTSLDTYYDDYKANNLTPNPELIEIMNSIQNKQPDLPNYGSLLSDFDSGSITSIPWDADNATYLQSDIVWGFVTQDASKSIFTKAYHEKLLSDPENLVENNNEMMYHSAVFGIKPTSLGDAVVLQIADASAAVAGQMALDAASSILTKAYKVAFAEEVVNRLQKSLKGVKLTTLEMMRGITLESKILSIEAEIAETLLLKESHLERQAAAIQQKQAIAAALTDEEKVIKAAAESKNIKNGAAVAADGTKTLKAVGIMDKFKAGVSKIRAVLKAVGVAIGKKLSAALEKFTIAFAIESAVIDSILVGMNMATKALDVFSFGISAELDAIITDLTILWFEFDMTCLFVTIVLSIVLPAILDKPLANGGLCTEGKPLDQIIDNDFLYFLIATFCPIGGLMDAWGPYACYLPDGSVKLKDPLYIPAYFSDSSLSLHKHIYPADKIPRGDKTSYTSKHPEWPVAGGIAREPCVDGTYTTSDVDMLCNIKSYVPETYTKGTHVPVTSTKYSHINPTKVKPTFIATYANSFGRNVKIPKLRACEPGQRDDGLECWEDAKCTTACTGNWDPSTWHCDTNCTGCGCVKKWALDRETCDFGDGINYTLYLSMCRTACPYGTNRVPEDETALLCKQGCVGDEDDWGFFCTGKSDKWCVDRASSDWCAKPENKNNRWCVDHSNGHGGGAYWEMVAGVCWKKCDPNTETDVGALCRPNCSKDEEDVLGVCWAQCPANTIDEGALCRETCSGDTPHDVAGICWGDCGNNALDEGAICRKNCDANFSDVAGVCWGDVGTYARKSEIPGSNKVYDPGYNPPAKLEDVTIPWCDFSKEVMLDRMAQFYYEQATLHPEKLDDGRIKYEFIVQFYGVISSSELSCDVACQIKTVMFDPVTGGNYEEKYGTTYEEDPGNSVSYRRFYFINIDAATATYLANNAATDPSLYNKTWPADSQGLFTVTGCTNSDYTAPDAMGRSTDPGVVPIMSLPKIFDIVSLKDNDHIDFSPANLATAAVSVGTAQILGLGAGALTGAKRNKKGDPIPLTTQQSLIAGGAQVIAAVGGGLAGEAETNAINAAMHVTQPVGVAVDNQVVGPVGGTSVEAGNAIFNVVTKNDNFYINHGPIYEVKARDNNGYVPNISFCAKVNTTSLLCSHELILRDTIDKFHSINPTKHIKIVDIIEPRGDDGCYYKFNTVSYNSEKNEEGSVSAVEEVVRKYEQNDLSTCVFTPTDTFITDMSQYPIRKYYDINTGTYAYPTRTIQPTPTLKARFVRIQCSLFSGDTNMRISQIAVYGTTGTNLALNRPVYVSRGTTPGYGPPNLIVDGRLASRSGNQNVWSGSGYIEIDLGNLLLISNVMFYGQLDTLNPQFDKGTRVQLLVSNEAAAIPLVESTLKTSNRIEKIDFATNMLIPNLPVKPFNVPRPLPPETNLGTACPVRCQDKNQIDTMIKTFNNENISSQIMSVIKAVTPSKDRCDYEVQMMSTNKDGIKTINKKVLSRTATMVSSLSNSPSVIYGKIIRIKSDNTNLNISQVVVTNAQGTNIALGKKTYASVNNTISTNPTKYGISSLVTDGNPKLRDMPNYWSSGNIPKMNIDVDLNIICDISSVTIYGVSGSNYTGVEVQILDSVSDAVPIFSKAWTAGNDIFTFNNSTSCSFTYTPLNTPYSFIQDTTPPLSSIDTSGGVLSFKNITNSIVGLYNTMIADVKKKNPLKTLDKDITDANTAVSNIVNVAAANLQITGCPTTKCNDPAILTSISNYYNSKNSTITSEYGAETNVMTQITKAGVSGQNTCDVMFTNLYSFYDDFLYPPVSSENSTMIKRFTMTNTGNCALQVAAGSEINDAIADPVGVISPSSVITPPFKVASCQVKCRDPTILSSVKTRLNSTTTGGKIPNFTSVLQSFPNGASTCEYLMTKDVTQGTTTSTAVQTYITATFNMNPSNCSFTLNTTTEVDPQLVETTQDSITGIIKAFINTVEITLPYLFNYDSTNPSSRVNESPMNL